MHEILRNPTHSTKQLNIVMKKSFDNVPSSWPEQLVGTRRYPFLHKNLLIRGTLLLYAACTGGRARHGSEGGDGISKQIFHGH